MTGLMPGTLLAAIHEIFRDMVAGLSPVGSGHPGGGRGNNSQAWIEPIGACVLTLYQRA